MSGGRKKEEENFMKNTEFAAMSYLEREGNMARALLKRVKAYLTVSQIREIVKALDLNYQHKIVVTDNPKEFGLLLKLSNKMDEASNGYRRITGEGVDILQSGIQFGEIGQYEGYQNGNLVANESWEKIAEFDISKLHVARVSEHYEDTYHSPEADCWEDKLVVYVPGQYPMDPVVQKLISELKLDQ
jgi:hypothetical protein